jgi:hypothetical protein
MLSTVPALVVMAHYSNKVNRSYEKAGQYHYKKEGRGE